MSGSNVVYLSAAMVDKRTEWPNRVREHRLAAGMTLEQLAEKADISVAMLGFIERGLRDMRFSHQQAIAGALKLQLGDLLNESDQSAHTQEEANLLRYFRQLDTQKKQAVQAVAESLSGYRSEVEREAGTRNRA